MESRSPSHPRSAVVTAAAVTTGHRLFFRLPRTRVPDVLERSSHRGHSVRIPLSKIAGLARIRTQVVELGDAVVPQLGVRVRVDSGFAVRLDVLPGALAQRQRASLFDQFGSPGL